MALTKPPLMTVEVEAEDVDLTPLYIYRRTVALWERTFRGRAAAQLNEGSIMITHLYELAFLLARAAGMPHTNAYNDFAEAYEVYEVESKGLTETVDPTPAEASTAP